MEKIRKDLSLFGIPATLRVSGEAVFEQEIRTQPRCFEENGRTFSIVATLAFGDRGGSNSAYFSITGSIFELDKKRGKWQEHSTGAIHEDIAQRMPEIRHLTDWHLCSVDGPLHYVHNTVYLAGNRDCYGLLEGEKRPIRDGKTGTLVWRLVTVAEDGKEVDVWPGYVSSDEKPTETFKLEWQLLCRVGKGKAREFDAARKAAIWPDATDEELSLPPAELTGKLMARLPALKAKFKEQMLACGFTWPGRPDSVS